MPVRPLLLSAFLLAGCAGPVPAPVEPAAAPSVSSPPTAATWPRGETCRTTAALLLAAPALPATAAEAPLVVVGGGDARLEADVGVPVVAGATADAHPCRVELGSLVLDPAATAAAQRRNPEHARLERELKSAQRDRRGWRGKTAKPAKTGDHGLNLLGGLVNLAVEAGASLLASNPSSEEKALEKELAATPEFVAAAPAPATGRLPLRLVAADGQAWHGEAKAVAGADGRLEAALSEVLRAAIAARPERTMTGEDAAPGPALRLSEADGVAFYVDPDHLLTAAALPEGSSLVPVEVPGLGKVWTMVEAEDEASGLALLYTPRPGAPLPLGRSDAAPAGGGGLPLGTPLMRGETVVGVVGIEGVVGADRLSAFIRGVTDVAPAAAPPTRAPPSPR